MNDHVFLDTNILIDLLGERVPFYRSAAILATLAEKKAIKISVSALSWPNIYYILRRQSSKEIVKHKMSLLKSILHTVDLSDREINLGLTSTFADFEDALQYYSALRVGCTVFITRNTKNYRSTEIPVLTPDEYISALNQK